MKFHEQHSRRRMSARKHELAKVAVLGNHDTILIHGTFDHHLIARASLNFGNRYQIMARCAQRPYNRTGTAFVGQKLHDSGFRCRW